MASRIAKWRHQVRCYLLNYPSLGWSLRYAHSLVDYNVRWLWDRMTLFGESAISFEWSRVIYISTLIDVCMDPSLLSLSRVITREYCIYRGADAAAVVAHLDWNQIKVPAAVSALCATWAVEKLVPDFMRYYFDIISTEYIAKSIFEYNSNLNLTTFRCTSNKNRRL